jgi:lipid II:glycine glycyltransferase (peptidoglycan interpeptide bridge formation enzyme)
MTDLFINPFIPRTHLAKKETYGYRLHIAQDIEDSAWDAFLARTPGGHHVQTSLWAQVKASLGWQPVRLTVTREGTTVAGAQILLRRLPLMGAVGYVSKGPLLTVEDPLLVELVIKKLQQLARDHRILFLVVQPPDNDRAITQELPWHGFRPSSRKVAPTATIVIDLAQDLDDILAQMHKKTRYGIRRAQRDGITVREGSEEDLDTVYELMLAAAERNQYAAYPRQYFNEIWHLFHPPGYIRMFLAEYQGETVSAHLVFPFGDTLLSKMGYWSGRHGKLKPNELLEWEVIQWAKAQGYRYYDFEGINIKTAEILQRGDPLPDSVLQTAVSFKLGFSQQVAIFPGAYEYIYHPIMRWAYNKLYLQLSKSKALKKMMHRIRTR